MINKYAWVVIYLNIPLWVYIGILGFGFGLWGIVKLLLWVNILALILSMITYKGGK